MAKVELQKHMYINLNIRIARFKTEEQLMNMELAMFLSDSTLGKSQ